MHRRDFLYNTGLLIPALLASPAMVLAAQKTITTAVLIIEPETGSLHAVTAAIDKLPIPGYQIKGEQVSHLGYSQQGFLITMNDNTLLLASKIIMHASCRVNTALSSMEINMGQKTFHLNFAAANHEHKMRPEYWFLKKQQFLAHKTSHFINRNRHILLSLSGA
jgi:hypothetical protein